jgi:hypothetical protein
VLVVAPLALAVVAAEEAAAAVVVAERAQDETVVSLAEGTQVVWMLYVAPPRKAAELAAGVDVVEAVVRSLDIVALVLAVELPEEVLALVDPACVEEDHVVAWAGRYEDCR